MAITARQISRSRPLPVFTRYLRPVDRLQVSTSFAEAIIAKYKASEEQDLPSVSFVYPETAALTAQNLDQLAAQLITLNRIRIRMNIHNHRWMQNYALSLESSCRSLLNQLSIRMQAAPGTISSSSVRELERVLQELSTEIAANVSGGTGGTSPGGRTAGSGERTDETAPGSGSRMIENTTNIYQPGAEEEHILRILTAASRGNGVRERYMSALYLRLQEAAGPERSGGSAAEILQRAGTEIFHIGNLAPVMRGWASEEARLFFWRVQRAPEQERNLILRAGGYTTILSLERELQGMDRTVFRRFSAELAERITNDSESFENRWEREISVERLVEQMSEEDWTQFTTELEQAGYVFRDGRLLMPGQEGTEATYNIEETGTVNFAEFPETAEGGELPDAGDISELVRNVELILRESTEAASAEETAAAGGPITPEEIPYWASEQARQLFWRIQRAPEQERRFFLQAGGFASMESLEKLLHTMDDVTFRRFSAQLLERLTRFSESSANALSARQGMARAAAQNAKTSAEQAEEGMAAEEQRTRAAAELIRETGSGILPDEISEIPDTASSRELIFREERAVSEEKREFTDILNERHEAAEILRRLLLDHVERTEIRSENETAGEALSEALLNLTMEEWEQFREELNSIDIENSTIYDLKNVFAAQQVEASVREAEGTAPGELASPELAFAAESGAALQGQTAEAGRDGLSSAAAQSGDRTAELQLARGMRMSREKREVIRTILELSRMPDRSFRTLERILTEQTVLREQSIQENSRQYFRSLSSRERENWTDFIGELLQDTAAGGIAPERVFLRMNGIQSVIISGMSGSGGEAGLTGAGAAGAMLEHLRETRVTETLTEAERTSAERISAGRNIAVPGYMDTPELIPADMDVPQRQAAAAPQAAARAAIPESRTEYNDIEFETVTHRVEEHVSRETDRDIQNLLSRMEEQEKELGRIRSVQEKLVERNIPREVLRKLEERAQMERLRGGR